MLTFVRFRIGLGGSRLSWLCKSVSANQFFVGKKLDFFFFYSFILVQWPSTMLHIFWKETLRSFEPQSVKTLWDALNLQRPPVMNHYSDKKGQRSKKTKHFFYIDIPSLRHCYKGGNTFYNWFGGFYINQSHLLQTLDNESVVKKKWSGPNPN